MLSVTVLAIYLIIEVQVRPVAKSLIQNKAEILSSDAVDDAITETINELDIAYSDIVIITYNSKHEIQSISTDIVTVNRLKAEISSKIHEKLSQVNNKEIGIPIGNFFGSQLLEGHGFNVYFAITLTGSANVNLVSSFTSAGINQTKHSLSVDIDTTVNVLNTAWSDTVKIKSSAALAETVIVGNVPELYADSQKTRSP